MKLCEYYKVKKNDKSINYGYCKKFKMPISCFGKIKIATCKDILQVKNKGV